eukprot:1156167-Amphidinium_carterae.1
MSLPEASAQVDLVEPVLPSEPVSHLQRPGAFSRDDLEEASFLPAPHFVHCEDWPGVAAQIISSGLARVCLSSEEPRLKHWHLRTGLFGVPKAEGDLVRLILDRRRANQGEKSLRALVIEDTGLAAERKVELLRYMTLPHSSQFVDL